MSDKPDRSHDTDPLADTQHPGGSESEASARAPSTARRSVQAGDTLGRYELVEDVGEGGMATVYRARDKELRREVAVKVLFPHLARRDEVVHRFHREARAAAGLEHANILRVYDVGGGDSDEPPYIVMELVRGHSLLGEIERRGPMLAEVAACIGALLADALAVAHKAGVIHRDIKPANVMIDGNGRVLLADFGVARLETEDSLVTKTGALLGTPAYMSPEQASGDIATAKSDLYSLGATLYQLATGHLPYSGPPAKVLAQIAQGSLVSAVRRRATAGPDLSRVIDRLMAIDSTARPTSATEVASELRAIAAAGGLGDPADELAAYFADPDVFVTQKLPVVVSALVASAHLALADEKLPRAMALADRASALAPDDPAVTQVITKITEGGRASRRRRIAAIVGLGIVVASGATFGAVHLLGAQEAARDVDAAVAAVADGRVEAPTDAVLVATAPDDAEASAMIVDAGVAVVRPDAGAVATRSRDAGVARVSPRRVDAAVAVEPRPRPDAAVAASNDAAVQLTAYLIIKNDLPWCDVTIDDMPRGRLSSKPLAVEPGRHTVTCAQPGTRNTWTKHVAVAAGKTEIVEGAMAGLIAITVEVDASIDGVAYKRGQVARLKAGRYELVVGQTKIRFDFRQPCRVRRTPDVGCY